jgi:hypothetical protein
MRGSARREVHVKTEKPFAESGTSPPVRVTVTRIDLVPGCTTATAFGRDSEGREVTFPADWRPALALAVALQGGLAVDVFLHDGRIVCWTAGGSRP